MLGQTIEISMRLNGTPEGVKLRMRAKDECAELEALKPTLADLQKPIRDARLIWLGVPTAFFVIAIGIMVTADQPNADRKFWAGFVIALICVPFQLFAILASVERMRKIAFSDDSEIDAIHSAECKSGWELRQEVREYGIAYGILLPLAYLGMWIGEHFGWGWGALLLAPLFLFVLARISIMGSRHAFQMAQHLEPVLDSKSYLSGEGLGGSLLRGSFVNQDDSFQVSKSWKKDFGFGSVNWCQYHNSGNSISSGIACTASLYLASLLTMAKMLGPISSVYYDESTGSIYGTFRSNEDDRHGHLAGVPWQFQHGHLIARLNTDLLSYLGKNKEINEEFVETIVDSWELLIHGLEGLLAEMEPYSETDG